MPDIIVPEGTPTDDSDLCLLTSDIRLLTSVFYGLWTIDYGLSLSIVHGPPGRRAFMPDIIVPEGTPTDDSDLCLLTSDIRLLTSVFYGLWTIDYGLSLPLPFTVIPQSILHKVDLLLLREICS